MSSHNTLRLFKKLTGILASCLILALPKIGDAQVVGPVPSPFEIFQQNGVANMAAIGDTLWVGPGMNRNIGNRAEWFLPVNADSVVDGRGRLFSIELAPDTVFAGIGFNKEVGDGDTEQTAMGYYRSIDGGNQWEFIPFPLEEQNDSTYLYGGVELEKLPVVVPEQSPPFEVDFLGNTVLSVNWASGLIRSTDFGTTWDRVILPPSTVDRLTPENFTPFVFDPLRDNNFLGFGLLIEPDSTVWVGTAGGLNISNNALSAPLDSVSWQHIGFNGQSNGLLSNWIITIKKQPDTDRIWLTNWIANANEGEFGLVYTEDGGQTFTQVLRGNRVFDVGFKDGAIFVASDNGLFISRDDGKSWKLVSQIRSANTFIKSSAEVLSLASTTKRIWVGTEDGLASSDDGGDSWDIQRVNVPLSGGNQIQPDAPDVESFAYPNPFSRRQHELVRIKFEVDDPGNVTINLYDFGMNHIRTLEDNQFGAGTYEAVWDGTDGQGRLVANGVVFYRIELPSNTANGKILVLD